MWGLNQPPLFRWLFPHEKNFLFQNVSKNAVTHFGLRSAGYEWLQVNKQKCNFVKVPASNIKTLSSNVTTIFAVPSSKPSAHDIPLKDLAKKRLKSRYDISSFSSFDDAMSVRKSCHIIEQSGSDFLCDCHEGKDV